MKKTIIILRSTIAITLTIIMMSLMSCEDLLTVDSNRYVTVDEHDLSSANDSVSSILGLLTGMQKVAERYVLLGEMRADLLDVTESTVSDIRQLSTYQVDQNNQYADPRDYYALINNCNYFISKTSAANSPLKNENALAHTIRAWTFMQIATHWGKVSYCTAPLLTVEDTQKEYPVLQIEQLLDSLISDLEPFLLSQYPNYGVINGFASARLFIPVKLMLAELHLWRGNNVSDFETAANYYAEILGSRYSGASISEPPSIRWSYNNFVLQNFDIASPINSWTSSTVAKSDNQEVVSVITMPIDASEGIINTIPLKYEEFAASDVVNDLWDQQKYVLKNSTGLTYELLTTTGDLRKKGNSIGTSTYADGTSFSVLAKVYNSSNVMLYRRALLLLRLAEALNRSGKPHTAFAVLKYGLKPLTFSTPSKIPSWELVNTGTYYTIFNDDKYELMTGIHARGCGDIDLDADYSIEAFKDESQDTIQWVENAIFSELALETSFEGNRFGDLVRIALRRDDPAFLAKNIAVKHPNDYIRIFNLLSSDTKNWYLPDPK